MQMLVAFAVGRLEGLDLAAWRVESADMYICGSIKSEGLAAIITSR